MLESRLSKSSRAVSQTGIDTHAHRILEQTLPDKETAGEQWPEMVAASIDDSLDHPVYQVLASQPSSVWTSSGAHGFVLSEPGLPDLIVSKPHTATNHHELSLLGILTCLERLHGHTGHVSILSRNQAAVKTILDTSDKINRHYARKADTLLREWFHADSSNVITFGWIPKEYSPPRLLALKRATRSNRKPHTTPVKSLSAASLLHEGGKDFNNAWDEQVSAHKYLGSSAMIFKLKGRRIRMRRRHSKLFINACGDNPHTFARFVRAATNHAPIGSYYERFPHFGQDWDCSSPERRFHSRTHILDECSNYFRHWESWLTEISHSDTFLRDFVGFLRSNPLAFSFGG